LGVGAHNIAEKAADGGFGAGLTDARATRYRSEATGCVDRAIAGVRVAQHYGTRRALKLCLGLLSVLAGQHDGRTGLERVGGAGVVIVEDVEAFIGQHGHEGFVDLACGVRDAGQVEFEVLCDEWVERVALGRAVVVAFVGEVGVFDVRLGGVEFAS